MNIKTLKTIAFILFLISGAALAATFLTSFLTGISMGRKAGELSEEADEPIVLHTKFEPHVWVVRMVNFLLSLTSWLILKHKSR